MGRLSTQERVKRALKPQAHEKGRHLSKADDEVVYQTALALESKAEAARQLNIPERTVHRAIARVESRKTAAQLEESRKNAAAALTSAVEEQTHEILESISEDDLKSGRIAIKDKNGEVVDYKYYGPSLLQKATSVGILTDKLRVLRDMENSVGKDLGSGALMMPEDADKLLSAIKNRVESIQVLQVNLRRDHPELATRLEPLMEVPAEVIPNADDERFPFDK